MSYSVYFFPFLIHDPQNFNVFNAIIASIALLHAATAGPTCMPACMRHACGVGDPASACSLTRSIVQLDFKHGDPVTMKRVKETMERVKGNGHVNEEDGHV